MRILIYGTGGVGGYFGGKLARAGYDVWFVARGTHLRALAANGLTINASDEHFVIPPGSVVEHPAEAEDMDAVLFCVKSYDTVEASRRLATVARPGTLIISLQNGIDNEEQIQSIIPDAHVVGGVAYIYATITKPGEITEWGGPRKLVFGPMNRAVDDRLTALHRLITGAGISAELTSDIRTELWKKFVFITAAAGLTALTRLTLGEILASSPAAAKLREAMNETCAVPAAEGIELPANLPDTFFEALGRFRNNTRSSMYHDLVNEKPMEVDALSGTVVRLARRHGLSVPVHDLIYDSLLPHHVRHLSLRSATA